MSTLYFATMLFLMNPFSYMSFFLSDRRFFVMDSANGLYAPSAYHVATVTASESSFPDCRGTGKPQGQFQQGFQEK